MSAATAEATAGSATAALAGLRVADVMTPAPDIGATWLTVSDFIDRVALDSAQTEFPVVGPDRVSRRRPWRITGGGHRGQATGPGAADQSKHHHAAAVIAVVPPVYIASPEDPATLLLSRPRPPLSGDLAAIVLTGSRIAGIVTVTRLRPTVRVMWPSCGLTARKGWRPPRPALRGGWWAWRGMTAWPGRRPGSWSSSMPPGAALGQGVPQSSFPMSVVA